MAQNIYDDPTFFASYIALRQNPNSANEMLEKPALFSLAPDLGGKRVLDLGCGCGENCAEFFRRGPFCFFIYWKIIFMAGRRSH